MCPLRSETTKIKGWLLDLYPDPDKGVVLWVITWEEDRRLALHQVFPVTFYIAGDFAVLRKIWREIQDDPRVISLSRDQKQDVFLPALLDVMAVQTRSPVDQVSLFRTLLEHYPDITYYDADLPIQVRHCARFATFPLALCNCTIDDACQLLDLQVLNSRWDTNPEMPPLRIMEICPDTDPAKAEPRSLLLSSDRFKTILPLDDPATYLPRLDELLRTYDPDILVTGWGDGWLIPFLLERCKETGLPLALNRDAGRKVCWQKETTYFSYGHIIYRPEAAHLFGRCHIDRKSAMMWGDYNLAGTLEMSRVTSLPVEKSARVSPGQGISAMQVITGLERGVLIPYQKQQTEQLKDGLELIQADRGGLVYQPLTGLHKDVAEIDFVSMYPAVIIQGNISPEVPLPEPDLTPAREELGIVPLTLKPLYEKRVAMKLKAARYRAENSTVKTLKARSSALKWLLVVCFGFLGYKNARFGRIEAHEAVTRGGREILMRAKEAAEAMGFEVLHMYVDALWIKKSGCFHPKHFEPLLYEITRRTGLSISLDGVYRWVAFLPSKTDDRIPVANRYFGVFQSGEIKIRGLECRRRDTPQWITEVQMQMIQCLAAAGSDAALPGAVLRAFSVYRKALREFKAELIPLEKLVISGKVSFDLARYKNTTAAVRAAIQLKEAGKTIKPGQRVRYLLTCGSPDVHAWELPAPKRLVPHTARYVELLTRAAASVLEPFGISPAELKEWSKTQTVQLPL